MKPDNSYPRVLIIGETFRTNGGGGITLINLFKNWNPDNIAIVTERINETSFQSGCKKFYRLGHLEVKVPFPFNFINKIQVSGNVEVEDTTNDAITTPQKRKIKQIVKFGIEKAYYRLLFFLGLYHSNYKIVISEQLFKWIKEYAPGIIYAQPFKYSDMVFAKELKEMTGIPLAIHMMDDSVSFLNKPNLLYLYWEKKINSTFRQLVEASDIHLCISKAMSEEYQKRYNKHFIPFRNPIEINAWEPFSKKKWTLKEEVNIIYTGRLAIPNIHALYTFCQVVDRLNSSGYNIKFHIYSIDTNSKFLNLTKKLTSVSINKPVPFLQIPTLITKFDIAFLPIDFTKKGIKYAKYSISTKTSEYMISGVPILLFAPEQVALTSYAKENNCMLSVSENNMDELSEKLIELISDIDLRTSLAKKAISTAVSDSDALIVRKKFKEALCFADR